MGGGADESAAGEREGRATRRGRAGADAGMPADNGDANDGAVPTDGGVALSKKRIQSCLDSSGFWVTELPRYAEREQRSADFWALLAGLVSAVTGLSLWPLMETPTTLGQIVFSAGALFAAVSALVPRIFNFGEMAGQARELTSRYGRVLGDLVDLSQADEFDTPQARAIVEEFEAIKERKDSLRRLPDKTNVLIERANAQRKLADAEGRVAEARARTAVG